VQPLRSTVNCASPATSICREADRRKSCLIITVQQRCRDAQPAPSHTTPFNLYILYTHRNGRLKEVFVRVAPFPAIDFAALHMRDARWIYTAGALIQSSILLASPSFHSLNYSAILQFSGTLPFVLMPAIVRHPTSHMPAIQFGVPSAMSAHSSNPPSSRGDCEGCVRKRRESHRNAREPKYCPRRK
jgi:hypothetical protein